ncbi:hypothetical protein AGR2A_Lc60165 [Agrobacterium genomosp. 2 str. CFBP 5494]|uniref:Uncharacterized protein n=1 Tax=Agrobacterium genomosp. 2 str. CFBP 5494 TaxID=1183436 RepID=A0A9W5B4Z3_9HYPH|nr:hypothetical protein AGR2A_Lc60165 [Agrobacterium genomosp. 2 str. CFBP 5494]
MAPRGHQATVTIVVREHGDLTEADGAPGILGTGRARNGGSSRSV